MKEILLFVSIMLFTFGNTQTLIWSDDFETTSSNWTLNNIPTGAVNGPNSNSWFLNDEEGGVPPPACAVNNNGNSTLYVGCQGANCPDIGATYYAGDDGSGAGSGQTDKRAELNAPISTAGKAYLQLKFDWIGRGQIDKDYAELEYSIDGGTIWVPIWRQTVGDVCSSNQGKWKEETLILPPGTFNKSGIKFAFRWINDNDGIGNRPSFAVDNMRLYSTMDVPLDSTFTDLHTPKYKICAGDCINFYDLSSGTGLSWNWSLNGGTPSSSTDKNPTNVCFATPGTYSISLQSSGNNGVDSYTRQLTVIDCPPLQADFTTNEFTICEGQCIRFEDLSTGMTLDSWSWTFDGATVSSSTSQNPSNICFNQKGVYDVTLTVTDKDGGISTKTQQITVTECEGAPIAMFSMNKPSVCQGQCVTFQDESVGKPKVWNWYFEGGSPMFSNKKSPKVCYDSAGVYNVALTVSNNHGTSELINSITVLDPPIIQGYGDATIDMLGSTVIGAVPYSAGIISWSPSNSLDCSTCPMTTASPEITTTYIVSLEDANGCIGTDEVTVYVNFEEIIDVPSAFSPNRDKVNDRIRVLGAGIKSIDFKIYNRYGQLVFETTDIKEGWDGKYEGEQLNQGVFVYTLDFELLDGSTGKKSGSITLIK